HKSATFDKIWRKAERRVAVDGGSKYLRCPQEHPFPDILNGDFDSVQTERLEYFRRNGTKIMETPDQDYTDFQKAVKIVLHLNKRAVYENNNVDTNGTGSSNGGAVAAGEDRQRQACGAIIAIWSSLGRIDQVLSNINTLYSNELDNGVDAGADGGRHYVPIILLQLHGSGTHVIESHGASKWCSLVPMGAPTRVTTTGFRWNLSQDVMSFGSLISTSNEFDANHSTVRVHTDRPLLYSYDISQSDPLPPVVHPNQ
ncbi:unnamed protein product, partial [Oppiella nova]